MLKEQMVIPGVYDALGAKIAQRAGFGAMFQTGYGTSASLFGMPDYGFVGAAETVDNARRICRAVSAPVIVDADTGYGNALSVWKITRELCDAGAAGMFLEDQKWPKRCGHMQGKEVIPQEEYTEKLGAALDARQDEDFVIVARTDSRATEGLDSAIGRSRQNLKTGADAVFIEAPDTIQEMERIGREIKAPLVANMIEGGATPAFTAKKLAEMGFGIVLYPLSALYAGAFAMAGVLEELKKSGDTSAYTDRLLTFNQFNEVVGLEEFRDMEKKFSRK
ncbi:MAG: oxaloacetate decarboxylase [Nitrosopumilus sp. B06]|nr:MAG: oxaloacetate decarboxylase [Nitrosopumilus sp. B06]